MILVVGATGMVGTDPMQKSFVGLMLSYASATAIDMTATLKAFPLKLRTVEDYVRSVMA